MSIFCTSIPVDLETLKQSLPTKAHLHSLTWDPAKKVLIAVWEDDDLDSGRTVAIDFPLEDLAKRILPVGVRNTPGGAARPERPALQPPAFVSSWKHPGSKLTPEVPVPAGPVATKAGLGVEGQSAKRVKGKQRSSVS